MERQDWTLLTIAAAEGDVSPVQLQKALFLLSKELSPRQLQTGKFYKFRAYDYGPFCRSVYTDAEGLAEQGLVDVDQPEHRRYRVYRALPEGVRHAEKLREGLSPDVVKFLDDTVKWVRSLRFRDLVAAIYRQYPDMKVNSVFRG